MMKIKKYLILLVIMFALFSCNDDDTNAYALGETNGINDFVWKGLNSWYYWKSDVPALQDEVLGNDQLYQSLLSDYTPEELFYSLLNDYPTTDRFSWIVDDVDELLASFSGIRKSNGMDYTLAIWNADEGTVLGMVNYVVPNSPADNQGIVRGDLFYGINGQTLTTSNYRSLTQDNITIDIAHDATIENGEVILSDTSTVQLISEVIEENPIHYYTYYQDDNRLIAYLVYNGYKANYNDELNDLFAEFQADGVTDLILDLRYNGGGSLNSALGLGQMITGQFTNSPFTKFDYNTAHDEYDRTIPFSNEIKLYEYQNGNLEATGTAPASTLNLNQLFVLTSNGSASASELTIACLEPYIDVVKIGSDTRGKFVGSITLFDDASSDFTSYEDRNTSHNYAMQPIVSAYFNANNEMYLQGITPDYEVTFGDYIGTLGEFGNRSDVALNQALNLITGSTERVTPSRLPFKEVESTKTLEQFGAILNLDDIEHDFSGNK